MPCRPRTLGVALTLLVAACSSDADDTDDTDTDAATLETDESDAAQACSGTLALTFAAAPEVMRPPPAWEDDASGAIIALEEHATGYDAERTASDCVLLSPGGVTVDLLPTGCGGRSVSALITPACNATCTELEARAADEVVGTNTNAESGVEHALAVSPSRVFDSVVLRGLDTTVCGVTIELAPLPEWLRPPDTGALF